MAGFPLRSECVWPGVRTDLFLAHLSVYLFFAERVRAKRVLDVGCGAGYGARVLVEAGARCVHGIDSTPSFIHFARRNYASDSIRFSVQDASTLALDPRSYDVVTSSNVFEHLEDPLGVVRRLRLGLAEGFRMLIAVPPILDQATLALNLGNPWHRSNLYVDEWAALFASEGLQVRQYFQRYEDPEIVLDFTDPRESRARLSSFLFEAVSEPLVPREPPLGVVFELSEDDRSGLFSEGERESAARGHDK